MTARFALPAFAGYGIELEYMIVDRRSLAVRPIADQLMRAFAGHGAAEVERGTLGWSDELVRHVVEVKNLVPAAALVELPARFHDVDLALNRDPALAARPACVRSAFGKIDRQP